MLTRKKSIRCRIALFTCLPYVMAAKGRIVYYNTEQTLRAVLEGQSDESELEVSDSSDTESAFI